MASQLSHILFFTKIAPFPPYGGEKIRSIELMKLLSQQAQTLTVVCPQLPENPEKYGIDTNVKFVLLPEIKRSRIGQKLFNKIGYFIRERSFTKLIAELHRCQPIGLAFIDYEFLGQYIRYFKQLGVPKVIYGTHNAQSVLTRQQKKSSLLGKADLRVKYWLHVRHERQYFRQADQLVVVSEEDAKFHAAFVDTKKIVVLPNFLDERIYSFGTISKAERKDRVIMTANFLSFQNIAGAVWFLDKVWDKSLSNRFNLTLVGLGSREFLDNFAQDRPAPPHCVALGEVDDVKGLIAASICAIVPLTHGSGSRLKVLEAMALGVPLVATPTGAEGIRHQGTIFVTDSVVQFRTYLTKISDMAEPDYEQLRKNLRSVFCRYYSHSASRSIAEQMTTAV